MNLLVFNTAYTWDFIRKYGLEIFITARDANKIFKNVYTVNPIANLQNTDSKKMKYWLPKMYKLDQRNIIIEGRTNRFRKLERLERLNFIAAQFSLIFFIISKTKLSKIELIRSEDPRLNGLYGYLFSRILRVPFVVGVWGNPGRLRAMNKQPIMPRLFRSMAQEAKIENFILKRADTVLVQNYENLEYVLQNGVPRSKTMFTELGIGIDRSHFLPKHSRLDLSTYFAKLDFHRCIRFICVSRLEKSKMVDHAILAMKIFGKENLNFKLFIIGDGRERNHLEALVNSEKLSQNVIFLGNRSQKWIAGAFNCVDINIAPLCGRSLLEASLAGLPSVAYDLDWHSEIVINNQTGFLVSPLNIDELSAKSLLLASNQDLRKIMSINMLRHANSIADPAKIAKRQADLYLKLIFENQL